MDDMTAFERQVAGEFVRRAGPVRPVNAAAIFTAITATQSPKWRFQSMFSATKFAVAGAIVALFGGLLLAGLLTQPSEEVAPAATSTGPGTFSPTGSLTQPRAEHTATLLPDGRVLVVGGFDVRQQDSSTSTAEIWDPATETFGPTGSLAEPRVSHTATLLPDGRVLVVGGWGDDDTEGRRSRITSAEVWDPSTGAFSPAGSTAMGGTAFTTLLPNGRVLVVLSDDRLVSAEVWEEVTSAEVWDPATSTFSPADSLQLDDQRATDLADGRVLIISDEDPYGNMYPASAEVWDPSTGAFSPAGSSALGRIRSATLLADGRVLFLGDHFTSDEDMTSAEVWDPLTSTFSPAGSFPGAYRGMNTVTALADGGALVTGGCRVRNICVEYYDSAEVWDPTTETFGPTGSPAETRMRHTATALPDGRVLVVGGWEYFTEGTVRASAEVWEPGEPKPEADVAADTPATPDLPPGVDLVTEEVEPGVYRVLSDGVRDLSTSNEVISQGGETRFFPLFGSEVVVGLDGSVWIFEGDGFFRIGDDATHQWEDDVYPFDPLGNSDVAVGPDGTLWRAGPLAPYDEDVSVELALLRSFDGREWDLRVPANGGGVPEVEVTADGAVWVAWGGDTECLGRLTGDAWEIIDAPGGCPDFNVSHLGGLWMSDQGVRILDGEAWRTIPYPSGLKTAYAKTEVGSDGMAWVQDEFGTLGRFDGTEWQVYDTSDGVPGWWMPVEMDPEVLGVAPDGSVWYPAGNSFPAEGESGCSVARFDGRTATSFLRGYCVIDLDIAPDGAVWLRAASVERPSETDVVHTYVITPEAVAGAE